jgi:hypothetical protein
MTSVAPVAAALHVATPLATPAVAENFSVALDTTKTNAPISKYIYGQFSKLLN